MAGYFITGTDTGIGKTWISTGIMAAFKNQRTSVVGMKPVASGCVRTEAGLRNEDALKLQAESSISAEYEVVNPYAFELPIAPHLAAGMTGATIDLAQIDASYRTLSSFAEITIVEGVGGWRVPLGDKQTLTELVVLLDIPVLLVVGLKLGCINHALLTVEAIKNDGLTLVAWVANQTEPGYLTLDATIDFLSANIDAPLMGCVPFMQRHDTDKIAAYLDISSLTV